MYGRRGHGRALHQMLRPALATWESATGLGMPSAKCTIGLKMDPSRPKSLGKHGDRFLPEGPRLRGADSSLPVGPAFHSTNRIAFGNKPNLKIKASLKRSIGNSRQLMKLLSYLKDPNRNGSKCNSIDQDSVIQLLVTLPFNRNLFKYWINNMDIQDNLMKYVCSIKRGRL